MSSRQQVQELSVSDARELLSTQFPQYRGDDIRIFESTATDNFVFKLGTDKVARFPRNSDAASKISKDAKWLPAFDMAVSTRVPKVLHVGTPARSYPFSWTVQHWLSGTDLTGSDTSSWTELASSLGQFVLDIRKIPAATGPGFGNYTSWRGAPLSTVEEHYRFCSAKTQEIGQADELVNGLDLAAVDEIFIRGLSARAWDKEDVWFHGDLTPGNILHEEKHLAAVIDFGCAGTGDPACDLLPAWSLFRGSARSAFQEVVALDHEARLRARSWAAYVGVTAFPYHLEKNRSFCVFARRLLNNILEDI